MTTAEMTLEEVRRRGIDALARELGPVGMIRFLQQFETGSGDYTHDRDRWLLDDVQAVMGEIVRMQAGGNNNPDRRVS